MATIPQRDQSLSGNVTFDLDASGLAGDTVDALLAQGKVEEARAEFDRLIQEGIDSGPSSESPEQMMKRLRARIRGRSAAAR